MRYHSLKHRPSSALFPIALVSALLVVAFWYARAAAGDDALVEVADATWTSDVANLQFTDRYEDGAKIPHGPIYLWTRMKATRRALEQLRRNGKLPIKHNWMRYVSTQVDLDREQPIDEISLGIGNAELVSRLERELTNVGYFDWRTWSKKSNVRSGGWVVEIVYNDGQPVMCPSHTGTTTTRCRYHVWIP